MIYVPAWNSDLKEGRDIEAFVPNVSAQLFKALGGVPSQAKTDKMATRYFSIPLSKSLPSPARKAEAPLGDVLMLGGTLTLKYIKSTSELQVHATYKLCYTDKDVERKDRAKKASSKRKGDSASPPEVDEPVVGDGLAEDKYGEHDGKGWYVEHDGKGREGIDVVGKEGIEVAAKGIDDGATAKPDDDSKASGGA